jgi:hypothetical protein
MHVAGIDAHATYLVVTVVSNTGERMQKPTRIANTEIDWLIDVLAPFQPIEVVVETSPAWPWLCDFVVRPGISFVLARAKKLRVIAEANYKRDEVDSELLARMRVAGLIPGGASQVHRAAGAGCAVTYAQRGYLANKVTSDSPIHVQLSGRKTVP